MVIHSRIKELISQSYYNLRVTRKALHLLGSIVPKHTIPDSAVVSLVSNKDFPSYLIALASLLRFLKAYPKIFVLNDGSLNESDILTLRRLPLSVNIIKKDDVFHYLESSREIMKFIFRHCNSYVLDRKLLDLLFVKEVYAIKAILLMDSDVVFFKYPSELLKHLLQEDRVDMLYNLDYQNAYVASKNTLRSFFGVSPVTRLNSGLITMNTSIIKRLWIQAYFRNLMKIPDQYITVAKYAEQTAFALLAKQVLSRSLDSLRYVVSLDPSPPEMICRHYVEPSRHYYLPDLDTYPL